MLPALALEKLSISSDQKIGSGAAFEVRRLMQPASLVLVGRRESRLQEHAEQRLPQRVDFVLGF
jgi:hypothetical protein